MPRLVVEKGIDKDKFIDAPAGGTILIGRDSSAGLRLGDMMASRLHFRIETRDDGIWLCDLKSMNGTYVNGERVHETRLNPGDRVQVGETLFTFVADEDVEEQDTLIGTVISGYKVLERVGRGGMGTVYKSEQLSLKRIVALKVISAEHTKDKTFVELFLREARAAAQLNHPNIVQVYDAKGAEGTYFYSMEFVPHGSVQDLLSAEKKMAPERAVKMALQSARGLEYAERKEIVHRDIKPDNLMIGELEIIKIADLGLAQSSKEASKLEESRTVLGTPHYIAPEQVLGRPADHRSDIYSLGATLYRMLSGTTPYTGSNVMEIVQRKVREDPTPLHTLDPSIPKSLSDLVGKMMARKPEERFQKVSEAVEALERYLSAPPATTISAGPRKSPRLPVAIWAGAGAAAAALLVVVIVWLSGGRNPGPTPPVKPSPGTGDPPPVVASPGSSEAEEELARVYFQQAAEFEAKLLKKDREASIQEGIARYQQILTKCPRSSKIEEAQDRIAALQGLLGNAAALSAMREAERADAEGFVRLVKQAQGRLPAIALVRAATSEAAARYAKVEQDHPRTESAKRSRQVRDHIQGWLALVESASTRFGETETTAQQAAAEGRFGAAVDVWKAFLQDQQAKALKSPFPDGRYGDLFAAAAADGRMQELVADAANAFQQAQQEANVFVAGEKFEEAKARYKKVIDTCGLPDIATRARAEIAAIDRKIIDKLDAERKAAEDKERQRVLEDDKRFTQATLAVQPLVRQYELQKAAETFRRDTVALVTDKNKAAAALRLQDLEAIARLKADLIRRINAADTPRDFNRFLRTKAQSGDMTGATEEKINIQVSIDGGSGGKAEIPTKWTELAPKDFCALFRGRWALSAEDLLGHGCAYQEFGFLEEADEAFKQAQAKATEEATREAAARHIDELLTARSGTGGNREAEAERRLTRARALAEQRRYADVKQELDAVLKTLADTEAVKKSRAEIDALLKESAEKMKGEEDKTRRSLRAQKHREAIGQELKDAQERRREIALRLQAMTDNLDKRYQSLLVVMAWQDWTQASTIGDGLLAAVEAQLPTFIANGEFAVPTSAYVELLHLATVKGDRVRFDRLAKDASDNLKAHPAWADPIAPSLAKWHDKTFPAAFADAEKLKAAIKEDLTPDLLWKLCKILRHDVPFRLEERQALRALLEIDPEFKEVASGEVLYRLAENAVAFREIPHAQALLTKLKSDYPECPRLKPGAPSPVTGVAPPAAADVLLQECEKLAQKLGYIRKTP